MTQKKPNLRERHRTDHEIHIQFGNSACSFGKSSPRSNQNRGENMQKTTKILILSSILFVSACAYTVRAQIIGKELAIKKSAVLTSKTAMEIKNTKITLNQTKQPLGRIFERFFVDYDIQIGFEESVYDEDHNDYWFEPYLNVSPQNVIEKYQSFNYSAEKNPITINVTNGRLEDVMDDIVRQMKNYKWEINLGVVNIYPEKGRNQIYESLLNLQIKEFKFEKDKAIRYVNQELQDLPEIKEFLVKNNLLSTPQRSTRNSGLDFKLDEEIIFTDLTLKELLNKLAKINRCGWILKKERSYEDKTKTKTVIRIVV
jgi:hypothetical protein